MDVIEDSLPQPSEFTQAADSGNQHEGGDLSHCPSNACQAECAMLPAYPAPQDPQVPAAPASESGIEQGLNSPAISTAQKPPYAILSMFDGCGS